MRCRWRGTVTGIIGATSEIEQNQGTKSLPERWLLGRRSARIAGWRPANIWGDSMKHLILIVAMTFAAVSVSQAATCSATAKEKKLHGAALTSFMNKCKKDATASCNADAKSKKLAGAAKTSFTKKCMTDAVGS
jgi:hypothetical protein